MYFLSYTVVDIPNIIRKILNPNHQGFHPLALVTYNADKEARVCIINHLGQVGIVLKDLFQSIICCSVDLSVIVRCDGFFDFPARTVGDPHLTTLDGYAYTFNGIGEFVYLKTNDDSFQSQIRFEQFRDSNGISNNMNCASYHKALIMIKSKNIWHIFTCMISTTFRKS